MQEVKPQGGVVDTTGESTTSIVPHAERFAPTTTQFRPQPAYSQRLLSDLPQAPHAVVTGQPNAWKKLALNTAMRAGLLAGGFYLAGIRSPKQLIVGSLASSATLSFLLTVHHAYVARRSW